MKQKKRKVLIIGHFGGDKEYLDGQTIKTKILYDELQLQSDWDIGKVDTYEKKNGLLKLIIRSISAILRSDAVIIMVHENGIKLYLPLLFIASKVFNKPIYHDVIGGDLPLFVEKHRCYKRYLNSFKSIWVETEIVKRELAEQGINNCVVVPNFKRLPVCDVACKEQKKDDDTRKFCTFSRVIKEKGIEDAVSAISEINRSAGRTVCALDIYGQIGDDYAVRFNEIMDAAPESINYKGTVAYSKSTETINQYDALLFPTYWQGECFPGTIIDAFSAGTPVIASDWNSNKEIICSGETGLVYPCEEAETLKSAVEWAINNPQELKLMRKNCTSAAKKYSPAVIVPKIVEMVERD